MDENHNGLKIDRSLARMAFDAVLALVVATVGFTVASVRDDLRELRAKYEAHDAAIASVRERMPIDYVRSEHYLRELAEFKTILIRIEAKVDQKVDRVDRVQPRGEASR